MLIKNCAIAFTNVLPTFAITVTFKDYKVLSPVINICFRLFLLQPSHLQNFVAGKHDYFFFYRYYWNYKIALPVAIILVLFNWRTGKTKIHILLYTMQHPRHFLIFGINLNEFAVS